MLAEREKHYPRQTSLATAVANITKPVTKNNFGPSIIVLELSVADNSGSVPNTQSYVEIELKSCQNVAFCF